MNKRARRIAIALLIVAFAAGAWAQTFTDVTATANIGEISGTSAAWGDYNNDGFYDLYVVTSSGPNRFYRNIGSGFLPDSLYAAQSPAYRGNVSLVDFDNDGDIDISVIGDTNYLLANSSSVFTRVSAMAESPSNPSGAAWADYDGDGDLDMYISSARGLPAFYRNDAGVFSNVVRSVGLDSDSYSGGFAWGDYNGDGYPDLYVSDVTRANGLYRNTHSGFDLIGMSQSAGGTVSWADYDNDGDQDIFLLYEGSPMRIFRNMAGVISSSLVEVAGVMGSEASWADYDNDGDLDVFVSKVNNRSKMFQNNGSGAFSEMTVAGLTGASAESAVWVDYDNDGDQDLFLVGSSCRLLRNGGNTNRWLAVRPVGTIANKGAIGVSVTVVAGGKRQRQDVGFASSRSQSTLPVLFGLGSTATADSVIVRWSPTSAQAFTGVGTNQSITLTQGSGGFVITPPGGGDGSAGSDTTGGTAGGDTTSGGGDTTTVVLAPGVAITPLTLAMDSTVVGFTTQKTFVVRNDSAVTLHITNVAVSGANAVDFSVIPGSATVESTGSRTFIVSFTPSSTGARQAEIRLTHDASGGVSAIPVSGRGVGTPSPDIGPQISIAPTSIMFDTTAVGSFDYATFAVSNGGTATLYVTGIMLTGRDPSHFDVSPTALNIGPGGNSVFTVTFRPASIGDKEAIAVVGSNAANNTVSIPLRGFTPIDRRRPTVSLSASVTRGVAPLTVRLTNHNSGGAVTWWNWNTDDRVPDVGTAFMDRYSFGDTLTYTYARPGVYDPILHIEGPGGSDSKWLSTSINDSIVVLAPQPPMPVLFTDTDTLNLGEIDIGTTTTSDLRIRNTGNSEMAVGLDIDGDNSFVIVTVDTLNVSPDTADVRIVSVRFLPLSVGTKTARLVVRYNGVPGTRSIYITGIARAIARPEEPVVPRPVFASSVSSVDAGRITVARGRSAVSFLVRNTGTALLTMNVFYRGSGSFTVRPDSMGLAPGASDSVRVVFAPELIGPASGRIYFNHNAGAGPFVVSLSGEGIQFVPSPQAADFNNSGVVDLIDFFLLSDQLARPIAERNTVVYDLTGDGRVDIEDFFRFSDFFGEEAPR